MGGFIPFPNVPQYPGVPALTRPISVAVADTPALSIALGSVENLLIGALQQPSRWGIFDQAGNQLGINSNSQSTLQAIGGALLSQLTGSNAPSLSTFDFSYRREARIANYQIEEGSFASYNKVVLPANPRVTLILEGSVNDRTTFLEAIEDAAISTDLYNVVTPEIIYTNYNVESYRVARRASEGATLLIVEVSLEEIRQITAAFSTVSIVAPQNAASTPQVSNGITQAATPDQSVLVQWKSQATSFYTNTLAPMFSGGK